MQSNSNPLIDLINSVANTPTVQPPVRTVCAPCSPNKSAANGVVRVTVKTHYGTKHFYPANNVADLFLRIQGGKTLTPASLRTLKAEGYEIEYRYEEIKL